MTRKDFNAIADALKEISDEKERRRVAELICTVCRRQNERFDKERFMAACGL